MSKNSIVLISNVRVNFSDLIAKSPSEILSVSVDGGMTSYMLEADSKQGSEVRWAGLSPLELPSDSTLILVPQYKSLQRDKALHRMGVQAMVIPGQDLANLCADSADGIFVWTRERLEFEISIIAEVQDRFSPLHEPDSHVGEKNSDRAISNEPEGEDDNGFESNSGLRKPQAYTGNLSRTQRAMCRILWRWSGYTQERVAEMLETTKQQVQFAIANRKNDDDRKDWDFVPEDLRKKYQGEPPKHTYKARGPRVLKARKVNRGKNEGGWA